jgi:hypothetical protein
MTRVAALRMATPFTVYRLPFTLFRTALFTLFLVACDPTIPPLGGPPVRITFTNVAELAPALSPDGGGLAFLRGTSLTDSTPASIWVMNLLSGGEQELVLPEGAGRPIDVGWEPDGGSLIVAASKKGLFRFDAPPADPGPRSVPAAERVPAESTLAVFLGDPVFARVVRCKTRRDLCVVGPSGRPKLLAQAVRDPVRWGGDSVAFFVGDRLQVRPLGPGRGRILMMTKAPDRPRGMTFFPGTREK